MQKNNKKSVKSIRKKAECNEREEGQTTIPQCDTSGKEVTCRLCDPPRSRSKVSRIPFTPHRLRAHIKAAHADAPPNKQASYFVRAMIEGQIPPTTLQPIEEWMGIFGGTRLEAPMEERSPQQEAAEILQETAAFCEEVRQERFNNKKKARSITNRRYTQPK